MPCQKSKKMAKSDKGSGVQKPKKNTKVNLQVKKPTSKREKFSCSKNLGVHVFWLFTGIEALVLLAIHKALIPATTLAYFGTVLFNGFPFLDDDIEVARIWRHYLYHDKICTIQENSDEEWGWLADSYLLGVQIKDEKFCNAIIDALVDKQIESGDYPTTLASAVYANTAPGDSLRELIVDMHVWAGHGAGLVDTEDAEEAPVQFHRAVRSRMRKLGGRIKDPKEKFPWEDVCVYHKHLTTGKCSA